VQRHRSLIYGTKYKQFSFIMSRIGHLDIEYVFDSPSTWKVDMDDTQWLNFFAHSPPSVLFLTALSVSP
jgi:hypothetical protein